MENHLQRITSRYWTQAITRFIAAPSELKVWWALPFMVAWINERLFGREDYDPLRWFKDHYIQNPIDRGLVIGCGAGEIERTLYTLGVCRYFDGFDISEDLVRTAAKKADAIAGGHFRYACTDLNTYTIPGADRYQLAVMHDALHHIENLEHLFDNLRHTLAHGALLWVNEYVGPDRSQMAKETFRAAEEIYYSLPKRYRIKPPAARGMRRFIHERLPSRFQRGRKFSIPTREEVLRADPSEAVRSSEILPMLRENFEVLHTVFWGNAVFPSIYALIAGAIDISREEDVRTLRSVWDRDGELVRTGAIPSHHVFMVLRNKK